MQEKTCKINKSKGKNDKMTNNDKSY